MLSYRLVLYYDICIVSLEYFFYLRHFKLDFFTLHYITVELQAQRHRVQSDDSSAIRVHAQLNEQ